MSRYGVLTERRVRQLERDHVDLRAALGRLKSRAYKQRDGQAAQPGGSGYANNVIASGCDWADSNAVTPNTAYTARGGVSSGQILTNQGGAPFAWVTKTGGAVLPQIKNKPAVADVFSIVFTGKVAADSTSSTGSADRLQLAIKVWNADGTAQLDVLNLTEFAVDFQANQNYPLSISSALQLSQKSYGGDITIVAELLRLDPLISIPVPQVGAGHLAITALLAT